MKNNKEITMNDWFEFDADKLKTKGVKCIKIEYKQNLINKIISFFYKKNKDIKEFNLEYWNAFKVEIINNLFNKKLCKIKFIR